MTEKPTHKKMEQSIKELEQAESKRKQAEQDLLKNEEQLLHFFKAFKPQFIHGPDTKNIKFNKQRSYIPTMPQGGMPINNRY